MMRFRTQDIGLLTLGAGRRLLIAAVLALTLWALFFWATSSPGIL